MRLLCLVAIASWTLALQAEPPSDQEGLSLRRIVDFWQEGEYQMAKQGMEEFLSQFPESEHASTLNAALGDLMLREKSYEKALDCYAKIGDAATADRVFLNRMQCLLHMQWYATLADECEAVLKREVPLEAETTVHARYLLAVALYQQCLNASEGALTETLAERAKPHFEALVGTSFAGEIAPAYAHVCAILKDFARASAIYLDVASRGGDEAEKMVFQAALLQSKYDKALALQTFEKISKQKNSYSREATYNWLVLQFELGNFETIGSVREETLAAIAPEQLGPARLIVGKSLLMLHQYEAASELLSLSLEGAPPEEEVRPTLVHLVEASYQAGHVKRLYMAIEKLKSLNPNDPFLVEAILAKVRLLKKSQDWSGAKEELEGLGARGEMPVAGRLEWMEVEFALKEWASCRGRALAFLQEFPTHEFAPHAWRFLLSASAELPSKEQLCADLEAMLKLGVGERDAERLDWEFLLGKTLFELNQFDRAVQQLEATLKSEAPFPNRANGELLLAFGYREQKDRGADYCLWAERALEHGATLIPSAKQHIALFNAYLAQGALDAASDHLYSALEAQEPVAEANLLWLAEHFYQRAEKDAALREKGLVAFARYLGGRECDPSTELLFLKWAKLSRGEGIFEQIVAAYAKAPEAEWSSAQEVFWLLGYAKKQAGESAAAEVLFDRAAALSPSWRNRFSAEAALQSALFKADRGECSRAMVALKNLVLQKRLANEPVHLEAALNYIDLASELEILPKRLAKRRALLKKTKGDFEAQEDIPSKDYHAARAGNLNQDRIFKLYMQFLDAELLSTEAALSSDAAQQKELQAKAKQILLQIASEPTPPPLLERVVKRTKSSNEPTS